MTKDCGCGTALSADEKKSEQRNRRSDGRQSHHGAALSRRDESLERSSPNERYRAELGEFFDGGFEEAINYGPEMVFGWQVKGAPQVQIGIDPSKSHSGSRSLRFVFQVRANLDPINVSQLVPVAETLNTILSIT